MNEMKVIPRGSRRRWIVIQDGPFYMEMSSEGTTFRMGDRGGAIRFKTEVEAESAVLLIASLDPEKIGRLRIHPIETYYEWV